MLKRLATTLPSLVIAYALLGSVVFTGVTLSGKLMGRWRVVKLFDADISSTYPPLTIDLDRSGKLIGRSRCGTFTGRWSTGNNEVRFQGIVPSGCNCGDLRMVEQRLIEAMGSARQTKLEKDGLILMDHGRPVAMLVPQRT